MSEKTIPEIQAEHGANASEILVGYQDALQEIRDIQEPEEGAYPGPALTRGAHEAP